MNIKVAGQGGQTSLNIIKSEEFAFEDVNNINKDNDENLKITEKDIKKSVDTLNKFLKDDNAYAEYNVHDKFGDIMIKIIDNKTKEVIMEVPPKKILDMVARLCELVGVVFDKKA